MDYQKLLQSLFKNAKTIKVNGFSMEERSCCDREFGKMDPRTEQASLATRADFLSNPQAYSDELLANMNRLLGPPQPAGYNALSLVRYTFGWRSTDISRGVGKKRIVLQSPAGPFSLWQYTDSRQTENSPCLVFIHGGGFVAGDIETVENQCKLLAQKMRGVVFSVDYPLAPEYKYPACLTACQAALDWVCQNAPALGVNRQNIGVAGDSAGGNLALSLALADRERAKRQIRYQCLIYPKLSDAEGPEEAFYFWRESLYENTAGSPLVAEQIRAIGEMMGEVRNWLLPQATQQKEQYKKQIAPISFGCRGLCTTLLVTAEYDYLRAECDAYFGMLKKAGVKARAIRYGGIFHGTFDRLGYAPQVEDILNEIAKDMQAL